MTDSPSVAIIGAGFGGLAAALELKRSGFENFVILERHDRVGGVWAANTYPGAACDVPSEIYSFSYALKPDWSRRFGTQREIRQYLDDVATGHVLEPHLRFGAEVTRITWDEEPMHWRLELADGDEVTADVVVCATGQLSRPKVPDVPGRASFRGAQFHSAEWDHDVELAGRRVAVVGGGASAIQVVPAIADAVRELVVVQRSPCWVVPKYDWRQGRVERALMHVPGATRLRHNLMWWKFEGNVPIISRKFDRFRKVLEARLRLLIRLKVRDGELARALIPDYPFGCNRVLLSSEWYPTLARDDVQVVSSGVEAVTEDGLVTADGQALKVDAIVWCTGFTATEYLAPMTVVGRGGVELRERWRHGPEAYLGMTTPSFPNLFMSYGPNTGSLTNTVIFMLERQAAYIRHAVELLDERGGALQVRRDVHDDYNRALQERLQGTVFTAGCPGWYTTAEGKVTTVWPGSHVSYARATSRFVIDDYEWTAPRRDPHSVRVAARMA
jgi:cation diffusion facilitator CzcD-associated flavoprotein CzcO